MVEKCSIIFYEKSYPVSANKLFCCLTSKKQKAVSELCFYRQEFSTTAGKVTDEQFDLEIRDISIHHNSQLWVVLQDCALDSFVI